MAKLIKCNIPRVRMDIPVFILMRALGVIDDQTIVEMMVGDVTAPENRQILQYLRASLEEASHIKTQDAALDELLTHSSGVYNVDRALFNETAAREAMLAHLGRELLPHLGAGEHRKKAVFIAWTASEVMRALLGNRGFDDRDSYRNKRIDLPGHLLTQLFYQLWIQKMIKDVKSSLKKELQGGSWKANLDFGDIVNKTNIYKIVKTPTIEAGLK